MLRVNVIHVTILADVLPAEQRLLGFLLLYLLQEPAVCISYLFTEPFRMIYSPLPLVLSLVLALLGTSLVVFLPETARGRNRLQTDQEDGDWWSWSKTCLHFRFRDFGPALLVAKSPNVLWAILACTSFTPAADRYWLIIYLIILFHYIGNYHTPELALPSFITRCLTLGLFLPALAIMLVHPNGHARFIGFKRGLILARISTVFAIAGVLLTLCHTTGCLVVGTIAVGRFISLRALC